jgi:chemotaxis protein histidine kinase CheA
MNKTLLLVICDFLLLNILALTNWEKSEPARPQQAPVPAMASGGNAATTKSDMVDVMKLSLEDERAQREQMVQQLQTTQTNLQEREQNLAALQTEKTKLSTTLTETQRNAQELAQRVDSATREATMSKERLAQLQRDLEQRQAESERQKQQLAQMEQAQSEARQKIENLNVAVKVAEQEKLLLRENAESLKTQVESERQESRKAVEATSQLAQGVGQLAQHSNELTTEIRENRPINANTLFNDFLANRVQTTFNAARASLFGPGNRTKESKTIFVADGKQVFALLHIDDTPFALREHSTDLDKLSVSFAKGAYKSNAPDIRFLAADPRIVAVPVDSAQVKAIGAKVYQVALEPFKFPEAVLISNGGSGYGEVSFKLDAEEPSYVRMDNRLMKRLFGDFSTSSGDLVLSKTGELLGIMVNRDYCVLINNFLPAKTILTGENIVEQHTGTTFDELYARLLRRPFKLQ